MLKQAGGREKSSDPSLTRELLLVPGILVDLVDSTLVIGIGRAIF